MATISKLDKIVDTNICFYFLQGRVIAKEWWEENQAGLAITDIIALELMRGMKNVHKRRAIEAFVNKLPVIKSNASDFSRARTCYRDWDREKAPNTPELPDMLIAQTAIGMELPIYTLNLKDFKDIPRLPGLIKPFEL